MPQVVVFTIVLTLAVGQNVALLCRTWCDANAVTASEPHHKNSSRASRVVGDANCDDVAAAATAVLTEDVRRGVSSQNANQAIPIPRYQLAQLTINPRPGQDARRGRMLEKRPLSTALRI